MAAAFFAEPLLQLDAKEASALAQALEEVNRHYKVPVISPEHTAIAALLMVAGSIYVPRVLLVVQKRKASKSKPEETPNVFPFPATFGGAAS